MSWAGEVQEQILLNIHNWRKGTAKIKASLTKDDNALRIGILSAGAINYAAIIDPTQTHAGATVTAIASRSKAKAEAQIAKYGIGSTCKAYGSYDELLADTAIDAVYISTPNGSHAEWAIKAMDAGKHVLVEKPLAANADEARRIRDTASATGKVALEAFHWRFYPAAHRVREIIQSNTYGHIKGVKSTFKIPQGVFGKDDIRFDYALAGGSSMDLAYVYSFCMYVGTLDKQGSDVRVLEASARPHVNDARIDAAMDAHFVIEAAGDRPAIDCRTSADSTVPPLWGFIPRLWVGPASGIVDLERAQIEYADFVLPAYGHKITVREKDASGRLTGKQHVEHCHAGGPLWGSRGESWWSTYRYQLEAFVDRVKATEAGSGELDYHGPWLTLDESVGLMELIDAVYEKAGLPKRGT